MYSPEIERLLKRLGIKPRDRVRITRNGETIEGILIPRPDFGDASILVIKLDTGYNMGVRFSPDMKIEKIAVPQPQRRASGRERKVEPVDKPAVSILHTGGTIASSVDYTTGAVSSKFTPEELVEMYPELGEIAALKSRLLMNIYSENMRFEHYEQMVREIAKEAESGVEGIIITHGTDTMHYTAAALAFALEDLPIPVILVGAQRSSDRGSSDAFLNLFSAVRFVTETDFAGVGICMHESINDESCVILPACRTRKMHSSRRDAFKAIDAAPIARIKYPKSGSGEIEFLVENYEKKSKAKKLKVYPKFDERVGIVKIHPNISPKVLEVYNNYNGLVLEGTGLGHAPIEHGNEEFFEALKRVAERCIVAMTTQCIYGDVNMNVYSTGRKLQSIGVIPCPMLSEVAYVKLAWLLGNFGKSETRELLTKNLRGEIVERRL